MSQTPGHETSHETSAADAVRPPKPRQPHSRQPTLQQPQLRRPRSRRLPYGRAALVVIATTALVAASTPPPGPLGLGDRIFPHLGNPGYDVLAYHLDFDYLGRNTDPLEAVTEIDARVTEPLEHINLDFARGTVHSVEVNGRPARFATAREDLVVTPDMPILPGMAMRVTVRHTSDPAAAGTKGETTSGGAGGAGDTADGGWLRTSDGLAMANQADAAHRVFPCNDHPSDKAIFTFRVTAPKDLTVVANGTRTERTPSGAATTWEYRSAHPMATELAQVSIGRSAVPVRTGPNGLPMRDVVRTRDREDMEKWLAKSPDQIAWMEGKIGRYPFETYGVLIADASTGFELETQTLSLFEHRLFTEPGFPEWYVDSVMVHELSHQWFGDSVSPRRWSDVWLNEAHATWYEALYAQEKSKISMTRRMREAYARSDGWRAQGGPPAAPKPPKDGRKIGIFRPVVYDGSALVLYALRERIGQPAFDRLERTWVSRHRDGVASTADFTALAAEISGQDLSEFFEKWLYGAKTPPMPGHADWRPAAPQKAAPHTRSRSGPEGGGVGTKGAPEDRR
ncbi:M1 family metallopeptidase [Streptomyces sp. H27-D2]|uniref:M1 family metallopeptidase n=1 Tax=Streptomyces sp. H27-D2 TaxID=3046304 RepID=UPI002DB83FF5|nr:M1 family metallopeptidase [Streptomyces sp. H27-D2]MEC4015876.1 M1 family metallopeptidase [Streptomyces sp. H27-D2]